MSVPRAGQSRHSLSRRTFLATAAVTPLIVAGLAAAPPAGAVALSGVGGTVSIADGLNFRTGPGTNYRIIRILPNGTWLNINATQGDWFRCVVSGTTGWVNSWYVVLSSNGSRAIYRGNTGRKMVALTFDAGADLGYTQQIIETLEAHGKTATFSLTGAWMNAFPDYAAWIAADGFQVMNHTLDHPSYTGYSDPSGPISPARRLSQLVANESRLASVAGCASKPYWRPPYGDIDDSVLRDVGAIGYSRTIMWTVDSMGWKGISQDQIYNNIMAKLGWGMIVLMHVGAASNDGPVLERVIHRFRDLGYAFGTVAQTIA